MTDLTEILKILDVIIQLEKKVEMAIASEKDTNRREKIEKAFKARDLAALRDALFIKP
jgi:hypothetical protein